MLFMLILLFFHVRFIRKTTQEMPTTTKYPHNLQFKDNPTPQTLDNDFDVLQTNRLGHSHCPLPTVYFQIDIRFPSLMEIILSAVSLTHLECKIHLENHWKLNLRRLTPYFLFFFSHGASNRTQGLTHIRQVLHWATILSPNTSDISSREWGTEIHSSVSYEQILGGGSSEHWTEHVFISFLEGVSVPGTRQLSELPCQSLSLEFSRTNRSYPYPP